MIPTRPDCWLREQPTVSPGVRPALGPRSLHCRGLSETPLFTSLLTIAIHALSHRDDISGQDEDLLPLPVPTARPDLRGGTKLDLAAGFNVREPVTGIRLASEIGKTVWQDLNGPQLGTDWWFLRGVQYSW